MMFERYVIVHKSSIGEEVEYWDEDQFDLAKESLKGWGRAYYIEDRKTFKIYTLKEINKEDK